MCKYDESGLGMLCKFFALKMLGLKWAQDFRLSGTLLGNVLAYSNWTAENS